MRVLFIFYFLIPCLAPINLYGQNQRDMQWILGFDTLTPDPLGDAILIDFKNGVPVTSNITTVDGFYMVGSNSSICDNEGNLLFYTNGCYIVNRKHEIMVNGDTINPGYIQSSFCAAGGGSPLRQGVLILPAVEDNCQYYVFNLDFLDTYPPDSTQFIGQAPQHLYYHVVDMSRDSGYGEIIQKLQIAVQDTFARGNIQATRHANGNDWWIIVPKSHSNCYFLTLLTANGIQPAQLSCSGKIWGDRDGIQTVFSPDGKKYIRFNGWDGLNIFDFDNATGELSNPLTIYFPNDTINYTSGVAVSPNSRYLYVCARKKVYQFDLAAADIESSKVLIATWDGYSNPSATLFHFAALGPDGKIYITSAGTTYNLHVIHSPDLPSLDCNLEQHGIVLPSLHFGSIPNFPNYRNQTTPLDCDSIYVSTTKLRTPLEFAVFPNPTAGIITVEVEEYAVNLVFEVHDMLGRVVGNFKLAPYPQQHIISLNNLLDGQYFYTILVNGERKQVGKFIKIE